MSSILVLIDTPDMEVGTREGIEAMLLREAKFHGFMCRLADELNSELSDHYEVRLVHLDTADYLEFVPRHTQE